MARASSGSRRTRSAREWGVRSGLAAAALVLGYVSVTQTLAYVTLKTDAERAYALGPGDGRIAGALALQIAAKDATPAQRIRADQLARRALAREPLSATALTALALDTQIAGDTAKARRLFSHSDALSRRELGTRLWLIEDAVGRGDVTAALRHYDIALRTEKNAPDLLFPILSAAISDPAIAGALARTLAARPTWGDAFVFQLGAGETDPRVRAAFLLRLMRSGYALPDAAPFGVLNALVASGEIEDAWRLYARLRTGVRRDHSRDPRFTAQFQMPMIFDWTPVVNDSGISASIQSAPSGGVFDFAASSTIGGVVLQQAQALQPGRYHLVGKSAEIDQPADARPYWQFACSDGRETARIEMPNSSTDDGRFSGEIVVGADCPVQFLRLVARQSSAIGGVTGRIEQVSLTPLGSH